MKKITKKGTFAAFLALAFFCFSGCDRIKEVYGSDAENPAAAAVPAEQASVYAVNTMNAAEGEIRDYLALSGDMVASSTVDTYSDAAGKVSRLYVSVGRHVERGQAIAEVDPSRPGMEFVASVVKAPVSGTVVALPAQLGMTVSQAVPIARIAGGAGLEIRLHVAERFISKIRLNQPCEISFDAYPGETFRGSISEISPTLDTASRTMEIHVTVENQGDRLKAGMFAKVRIITEQKSNIVKIPASAVVNRFGEQFVFMVDSSDPAAPVARKRVITEGILIDGVLEVTNGLEPGEEIVIRGQTLLEDGSRINIVERQTPFGAN